ncbi:hypothetical protein TNCV_3699411 [Trichonephila clavipes]|uniref:Uncharacterized protein n=1 Tax=Trichonephila clavipes TaxID=2585209 RepID=A0A8X6VKZ3_TRICX|nr:hypothetical protein TNCV_3699411 [Trichonephila clavipes]
MFLFKSLVIVWITKCDVYGNWIPSESETLKSKARLFERKKLWKNFQKPTKLKTIVELCFYLGNPKPQHCPQTWLMQKKKKKKRFDSLQKRLTFIDDLKKEYERGMLNYIEQEHVEVCQLET